MTWAYEAEADFVRSPERPFVVIDISGVHGEPPIRRALKKELTSNMVMIMLRISERHANGVANDSRFVIVVAEHIPKKAEWQQKNSANRLFQIIRLERTTSEISFCPIDV